MNHAFLVRVRQRARDIAQQLFDADGFLGNGGDQFNVGQIGDVFAQHDSAPGG